MKSTLGQLGILAAPASTNQACCAFLAKPNCYYSYSYLFQFLKQKRVGFLNLSMGAAQQNISQEIIKNSEYLSPNVEVLKQFEKVAEPIFEEVKILNQKNQLLQQTRDLLLPRLISGKLNVEKLIENLQEPFLMAAEPEISYQIH